MSFPSFDELKVMRANCFAQRFALHYKDFLKELQKRLIECNCETITLDFVPCLKNDIKVLSFHNESNEICYESATCVQDFVRFLRVKGYGVDDIKATELVINLARQTE